MAHQHHLSLIVIVAFLVAFLAPSIHMTAAVPQGTVDAVTPTPKSSSADPLTRDDGADDRDEAENKKLAPFLIRLHLLRHGETHANVKNLVLGQGDSPLTDDGVAVASAATAYVEGLRFWRTYCSDLYRAHRTARIVLGLEDGDGNARGTTSDVDLIVDSRLRELAKGAREGYLKKLSHDEAMAMRRREAGISDNEVEIEVPKLESIDDAWRRAKDWIDCLVRDASDDYYSFNDAKEGQDDASCDSNESENDPKIYDVFALSHSALIRTMIHKMVDAELPSNYATTKEGSLSIPNLSCTVIDVRPYECHHFPKERDDHSIRWRPSLFRLTDVSHLSKVPPKGPPYL